MIANDVRPPIDRRIFFHISQKLTLSLDIVNYFFPGAVGLKFRSDDKKWHNVRVEQCLLCFSADDNKWSKEVYIPIYLPGNTYLKRFLRSNKITSYILAQFVLS